MSGGGGGGGGGGGRVERERVLAATERWERWRANRENIEVYVEVMRSGLSGVDADAWDRLMRDAETLAEDVRSGSGSGVSERDVAALNAVNRARWYVVVQPVQVIRGAGGRVEALAGPGGSLELTRERRSALGEAMAAVAAWRMRRGRAAEERAAAGEWWVE